MVCRTFALVPVSLLARKGVDGIALEGLSAWLANAK
jgi:hypothetical protein